MYTSLACFLRSHLYIIILLSMILNVPLYYHFYWLHIIFVVYFLDAISSFCLNKQQCDEHPSKY